MHWNSILVGLLEKGRPTWPLGCKALDDSRVSQHLRRKLRQGIVDARAVLIVAFEHEVAATPKIHACIEMPIKHCHTLKAILKTSYPLLEMPKRLR